MPREHLLKIGVSGIRGVVGEFLTPALACSFGQAFGTYVGRVKVIVVGILPTPTIQMYVGATRAHGGIALTASHNPPEYNALKLFNAQGQFFNTYERAELLDLYHQSDFRQAPNEEMRRVVTDYASAPKLHFD